ncbi:MAG: nucleoside triphosphate pyrophosphohydrolase [Candidatus Thorarchaeota archaeon]
MPEKLVRDKIPDIIRQNGGIPIIRVASCEELDYLIRLKVVEEAQELLSSGEDEEIADVLEALQALILHRSIKQDEIEQIRLKKRTARGGFEKGFVLETEE